MRYRALSIYLCVLFLVTLFLRILLVDYYDPNLGGIEPNVIYGIQRILTGQPLYQDPQAGTFAIMQYTPLWYYAAAGIARMVSSDGYHHGLDVHGIYVLSRILALLCNLITVGLLVAIMRSQKASWSVSIMLSFAAFVTITAHFFTRGDSLYLLLFVLSFWLYIRYLRRSSMALLLLTALASAVCIMTKQSGVLVCGIITICLSTVAQKRLISLLYLLATLFFSAIIAWYFAGSDRRSFFLNTVKGLANGIDATFLWRFFVSQYFLDMVPCYLLGGVILVFVFRRSVGNISRSLVAGMVMSWVFAVVTGLKVGSSNNYFAEFLILLLTALPLILDSETTGDARFTVGNRKLSIRAIATAAVLVIATSRTAGLFTGVYIDKSFKNDQKEYLREQQLYTYFIDTLSIREGEHVFFTERRYLDNLFVNYSLMPTKDVVTQVFETNPATFGYNHFINGMNSGLVKYIVTSAARDDINICNDSLPFIVFDKRKFRQVARVSGFVVYAWSPG